jgi:uncharacterized protein YbaP (TraB family)
MKKIVVFLFFTVISISFVSAQLLWKVSGNGLKRTSYIFGTHHIVPIQFLDSVPGLYKAFNSCDMIIGEMVISNVDATAKIQQAAIMPNHIRINDLLSEEDYKKVDAELKSVMKLGLKELSIMNPALILTLYQMELYKKQIGFSDDVQSDSYFQLVAAEKGKKVIGLETVEQQIKVLFGDNNYQRQADILVETVLRKDSIINEMANLTKLYKAGKLEELITLSKRKGKITDMTDEEYQKLVDNRNADWLTKLPDLMKNSSCFIAVGALHLGGEKGLINQLRKSGYKVQGVN